MTYDVLCSRNYAGISDKYTYEIWFHTENLGISLNKIYFVFLFFAFPILIFLFIFVFLLKYDPSKNVDWVTYTSSKTK